MGPQTWVPTAGETLHPTRVGDQSASPTSTATGRSACSSNAGSGATVEGRGMRYSRSSSQSEEPGSRRTIHD